MNEITHCAKCGKVFETFVPRTVMTDWGEDFCSVPCFMAYQRNPKRVPAKVKES